MDELRVQGITCWVSQVRMSSSWCSLESVGQSPSKKMSENSLEPLKNLDFWLWNYTIYSGFLGFVWVKHFQEGFLRPKPIEAIPISYIPSHRGFHVHLFFASWSWLVFHEVPTPNCCWVNNGIHVQNAKIQLRSLLRQAVKNRWVCKLLWDSVKGGFQVQISNYSLGQSFLFGEDWRCFPNILCGTWLS